MSDEKPILIDAVDGPRGDAVAEVVAAPASESGRALEIETIIRAVPGVKAVYASRSRMVDAALTAARVFLRPTESSTTAPRISLRVTPTTVAVSAEVAIESSAVTAGSPAIAATAPDTARAVADAVREFCAEVYPDLDCSVDVRIAFVA